MAAKKTKSLKKAVKKNKVSSKSPTRGKPVKNKAKVKKPVKAKVAKKLPAKTLKAVKSPKKATPAPKKAVAVKSAPPRFSSKPIIRTGPSKIPTSYGKSPLSAFGRGMVKPLKPSTAKPLKKKEMEFYKDLLLKLRDRVIDEISFLANDNLNRSAKESSGDLSSYSFHMADQGTDNFDREFAASLLNNEHDILYEIEEALRRIEQGTYGICEMSNRPIERERLKALPFVRYCVSVQSEIERGKPRFRPFRRTSIQTADAGTN